MAKFVVVEFPKENWCPNQGNKWEKCLHVHIAYLWIRFACRNVNYNKIMGMANWVIMYAHVHNLRCVCLMNINIYAFRSEGMLRV